MFISIGYLKVLNNNEEKLLGKYRQHIEALYFAVANFVFNGCPR